MIVWVVEACCNDEYGCMELCDIFSTKEKAMQYIKDNELQTKHPSDGPWNHCMDYATVRPWTIV